MLLTADRESLTLVGWCLTIVGLQVLSDLNTAASELGLGPRPLDVAVVNPEGDDGDDGDDDDDDENKEEGEVIMVSIKNGLTGQSSASVPQSLGRSSRSGGHFLNRLARVMKHYARK